MPHTQPEQTPGQVGAPHPTSETPTAPDGQGMPTLHEFLTRLVGDPQARSAFEADPSASLQGAGLGDMTATDVLQSASLVLDYAPVEVVQEYGRSLQSSVETFAASTQHVAIKHLDPAQEHGWGPAPEDPPREPEPEPPREPAPEHEQQEATEPMLHNSGSNSDFSANGDADEQMMPQPAPSGDTNIELNQEQTDSQNLVNVHDVLSGNEIGNGNAIGAVGNTVEGVVGGAGNAVGGVADGAMGTVDNTVDTVGDTADTATGMVDETADTATGMVAGAPDAAGNLLGDVTDDAAHLTGGATSALPLDGLL